jgi:hypothetical protein
MRATLGYLSRHCMLRTAHSQEPSTYVSQRRQHPSNLLFPNLTFTPSCHDPLHPPPTAPQVQALLHVMLQLAVLLVSVQVLCVLHPSMIITLYGVAAMNVSEVVTVHSPSQCWPQCISTMSEPCLTLVSRLSDVDHSPFLRSYLLETVYQPHDSSHDGPISSRLACPRSPQRFALCSPPSHHRTSLYQDTLLGILLSYLSTTSSPISLGSPTSIIVARLVSLTQYSRQITVLAQQPSLNRPLFHSPYGPPCSTRTALLAVRSSNTAAATPYWC